MSPSQQNNLLSSTYEYWLGRPQVCRVIIRFQRFSSTTRVVVASGASTFSDYIMRNTLTTNHLDDINVREWVVEIDYFRGSTARNFKIKIVLELLSILLNGLTYLLRTDLLLVRRTMTTLSVFERHRRKPTKILSVKLQRENIPIITMHRNGRRIMIRISCLIMKTQSISIVAIPNWS